MRAAMRAALLIAVSAHSALRPPARALALADVSGASSRSLVKDHASADGGFLSTGLALAGIGGAAAVGCCYCCFKGSKEPAEPEAKAKEREAKEREAKASGCRAAGHQTASRTRAALRDPGYASSWICDGCGSQCTDEHEPFQHCHKCRVDFCVRCTGPAEAAPVKPTPPASPLKPAEAAPAKPTPPASPLKPAEAAPAKPDLVLVVEEVAREEEEEEFYSPRTEESPEAEEARGKKRTSSDVAAPEVEPTDLPPKESPRGKKSKGAKGKKSG